MITPPDRPPVATSKWVMMYRSFDPARNQRYDFSEPYLFDDKDTAVGAARGAKAANPHLNVLYAVVYPPVGHGGEPQVIDFQQ